MLKHTISTRNLALRYPKAAKKRRIQKKWANRAQRTFFVKNKLFIRENFVSCKPEDFTLAIYAPYCELVITNGYLL